MEIKKTVISDSHFSRCKYIKYSKKMHKIAFFFLVSLLQSVNSCIIGFIDIFGQLPGGLSLEYAGENTYRF